jgi:hypothetical protein
LRALTERAGSERESSIARELSRLDTLEARIRARDVDDPEKLAGSVAGIEKMRILLSGLSH